MLKSYTISTSEVDEVKFALEDLKGQLDDIELLGNSVGIIVCHYDYINNGIVEAVSDMLPFSTVGFTSFFQKSDKVEGLFQMNITILTADDVKFTLGESAFSDNNMTPADKIRSTYRDLLSQGGEKPAIIFNFLSVERPISGDEYIRILDSESGGVPLFGGIASSDKEVGGNIYVFSNGRAFSNGFAMLLISGNVEPKFNYVNYSEAKFVDMTATITRSDGETLQEINGLTAKDFLYNTGLNINDQNKDGLQTVPFLYKKNAAGPYIARIAYDIEDDGSLKLFGEIPEGAEFRIGTGNSSDIIRDSESTIQKAVVDVGSAGAIFIFSCIGRYMSLGVGSQSEFGNFDKIMHPGITYIAGYVAGEICPVANNGQFNNEFHNSSFVICSLEQNA